MSIRDDFTSPKALIKSIEGYKQIEIQQNDSVSYGYPLPSKDECPIAHGAAKKSADFRRDLDAELAEDLEEPAADIRSLSGEIAPSIVAKCKEATDEICAIKEAWQPELGERAVENGRSQIALRSMQRQQDVSDADFFRLKQARSISLKSFSGETIVLTCAAFASGNAGGVVGALFGSVALSAVTVMSGIHAGKANAGAKAHSSDEALKYRRRGTLFGAIAFTTPLIARFAASGLDAFFEPMSWITVGTTLGLFFWNKDAWSKVPFDLSDHEVKQRKVEEADAAVSGALHAALEDLAAKREEEISWIDETVKALDDRWTVIADAARDFGTDRTEQYRADRLSAQKVEADSVAYCWGELTRNLEGKRDLKGELIRIPDYMKQAPDLSGAWATPSPLASIDWDELYEQARAARAAAHDAAEKGRASIQKAFDDAVAILLGQQAEAKQAVRMGAVPAPPQSAIVPAE